MSRAFTGIVIFIFFAAFDAWSTIINIPGDYPEIQQGINAGIDGDTVLVHPGTYVENVNFNGHNVVLGSLFLTTGDTAYIDQTVIDGAGNDRVVTFENGEANTAAIIGFTIQNGQSSSGGGIRCSNCDPVISNNKIINNIATSFGGGIQCNTASPLITDNVISNNSAHSNGGGISCGYSANPEIINNLISHNSARTRGGGGIYCYSSNPVIDGNLIDSNTVQGSSASGHGGGICCYYNASPSIINNIISNNLIDGGPTNANGGGIDCVDNCNPVIRYNTIIGNRSLNVEGYGGGIKCVSSNPVIEYNIISGNIADSACGGIDFVTSGNSTVLAYNVISDNISNGWCGGIGCVSNSNPTIHNNTIYGNSANTGGGLICWFNSDPEITNTIFWGDSTDTNIEILTDGSSTPAITYCDVEGGHTGVGNIDTDPLFFDPANGDFHLTSGSPCIDAGCPDSPLDPDGTICDIGAFYFDQTGIEYCVLPNGFSLAQNYPNPFNASTTIQFTIPEPRYIQLSIYDLLGRQVRTLLDEFRQAGTHTIIFDASDLSSGVYFYRLRAEEAGETRRMVLLK